MITFRRDRTLRMILSTEPRCIADETNSQENAGHSWGSTESTPALLSRNGQTRLEAQTTVWAACLCGQWDLKAKSFFLLRVGGFPLEQRHAAAGLLSQEQPVLPIRESQVLWIKLEE